MTPNTHNIRNCFNKAAQSYDQYNAIQKEVCQKLLLMLKTKVVHSERIIDLACGTGESTKMLMNHIPDTTCLAIDIAERSIQIATQKLEKYPIEFQVADFNKPHTLTHKINIIFCNMGLQWSENLTQNLFYIHHALADGGLVAFSMPVSGNFPEIKNGFKLILPGVNRILNNLSQASLTIEQCMVQEYTIQDKNPILLLKQIKSLGANISHQKTTWQTGLSKNKILQIFKNPKTTQLTYKIGFFIARRKYD